MITIKEAVENILNQDDSSHVALYRGVLNLSAYAKRIRKQVEKFTKKEVKESTIVTTLSRAQSTLKKRGAIIPDVEILEIALKNNIVELSYEKTEELIKRLAEIQKKLADHGSNFMTITLGVHEVTVLASENIVHKIKVALKNHKPKLRLGKLVAITVHSKPEIINIPNITYAILRRLATNNINLVEVVSTYTEITLIVAEDDASQVISLLN